MSETQEPVIALNQVTVRYNLASEKVDNMKEYLVKFFKKQLLFQEFIALKNVSLNIYRGESWGVVGRNGAGKSTMLKLICGILAPYRGRVRIAGRIAPLIELGAGFDGNLTALENIMLNGAILGRNRVEMMERVDEILDFSELRDFANVPIKNFSSGMYARLGFAVATLVNPEILVVDEVLSVGDLAFRKKCEKRMQELLDNNTTLLLVSHSSDSVCKMCKKAIWLDHGESVLQGDAIDVCKAYEEKYN